MKADYAILEACTKLRSLRGAASLKEMQVVLCCFSDAREGVVGLVSHDREGEDRPEEPPEAGQGAREASERGRVRLGGGECAPSATG